jgi:hypothetical protein
LTETESEEQGAERGEWDQLSGVRGQLTETEGGERSAESRERTAENRGHAVRRCGIKILEDAACAIGSRYKGRAIGGHLEMACFSFHPRKVITTGEGGMITTNKAQYAQHLRLLRQHGMSVSDTVRL